MLLLKFDQISAAVAVRARRGGKMPASHSDTSPLGTSSRQPHTRQETSRLRSQPAEHLPSTEDATRVLFKGFLTTKKNNTEENCCRWCS